MFESTKPHEATYLMKVLIEVLADYGVDKRQIYTITSDNGANLVKMVDILSNEIIFDEDNENDQYFFNENSENLIIEDDERKIAKLNTQYVNKNEDKETEAIFESTETGVFNIRCGAHTLQLAINDTFKLPELDSLLSRVRYVAKKLRNKNIYNLLSSMGFLSAKIDSLTRWNSGYMMVSRIYELRKFITDMEKTIPSISISDEEWVKIEVFLKVFEAAKSATIKMEKSDLIIGDFFSIWLELKLNVEKFSSSSIYAQVLIRNIKARELLLFENAPFISGLYLDPRFNFLLSDRDVKVARKHLLMVGKRILDLGKEKESRNPQIEVVEICNNDENLSELERFLIRTEDQMYPNTSFINLISTKYDLLDSQIINFRPKRQSQNLDVLNYWELNKNVSNELYQVSSVVLGIPVTQVSVERNFSILRLVLTDKRMRLSKNSLESILMCRLNPIIN